MCYTIHMNTSTQVESLPIVAGDIVVEVVGNEPRIWRVQEDGRKLKMVGHSYVFMRQRGIQFVAPRDGKHFYSAPNFTVARLFNRKNRESGAALVRSYFPEAVGVNIHFFHQGSGPSGNYWCFSKDSHYTIR